MSFAKRNVKQLFVILDRQIKFLGSGCLMLLSSMFDAGEEACWSTVPLIVWNRIGSKGQDKIASHSEIWSNPNTSRNLLFEAPSWQSLDSHYLSFFFSTRLFFLCQTHAFPMQGCIISDRICRNYHFQKFGRETNYWYRDSSTVKNTPHNTQQHLTSVLSVLISK